MDKRVPTTGRFIRVGGMAGPQAWTPEIDFMRLPDVVLGAVVFLGFRVRPGFPGAALDYRGTGFVVSVQHRGIQFYYLVTAKHVAKAILELDDPIARLNDIHGEAFDTELRDTPHAAADALGIPRDMGWKHHADTTVDLAVLPFIPWDHNARVRPEDHYYQQRPIAHVPDFLLAADEQFGPNGFGIGDEVYIPGLFAFAKGERSLSPICRVGNLAMVPRERIEIGEADFAEMEAYLVEARSIGGLSGSPVFIRETVALEPPQGEYDRFDQGRPQFHASGRFFLLGVVHGHWDISPEQFNSPDPDTATRKSGGVNVGVAIVTPARKLREILFREDVVRHRNQFVDALPRQKARVTLDSLSAEEPGKPTFEQAAPALFQVPKSAVDQLEGKPRKRRRES